MKIQKMKTTTKKKTKSTMKRKKQLSNVTTDDFFSQNFNDVPNIEDNAVQGKFVLSECK